MHVSDAPPSLPSKLWLYFLGLVLFLAGAFFVVAGGKLVSLGVAGTFSSPAF
jgi:hypothetical protein